MHQATKSKSDPRCFIDEEAIRRHLERAATPAQDRARDVLAKARELKGLDFADVSVLLNTHDRAVVEEMLASARDVKEAIYGSRLVLFAPLYISNFCCNDCTYCAFRTSNKAMRRKALTQEEIADEVRLLVRQGHKRLLLVAGEAYPQGGLEYIYETIRTVYATKEGNGAIRRLNVNIAPLTVEEFRELKACGIGTYQLFQETYHRATYANLHSRGPKSDYLGRLDAIDRAFTAGIDDVGIGVLFGLCDYRFEALALLQHIRHLEATFGVGCHTISVPRLEPATGSTVASNPPAPVADDDFRKLIAILRLAVPYTGLILSTRESAAMRASAFSLGISQISAGSRTNPGGYGHGGQAGEQFQLGDHRSLDEVIRDVARMGYVPSFCTGCYRLGRTGEDFMDLAKPGLIKQFCLPNALLTFKEYLTDYASPETKAVGEPLVARQLEEIPKAGRREETVRRLERIEGGERDLYF